ncbi:zinc-dependent alcohol dehydrogenase family protein [Halorubrum ezzemoulense]|uniref:Alcohol dehydrogenase n=1 Tax=Halorubrum ezzemoulense TaxID=337243 RepID=A0A256JKB0_HALEZ|nr:zinc-dependent alcohol dehydrogenase family protein [Halorubrum ezzemoulense]MDB9235429.1 zinc-dependent alcohol dehydrogenase family protein [Halorubrum ezzemoulense]OYR68832.1 alcohol dehydrogenase [Halorubrum ezzemoulense]
MRTAAVLTEYDTPLDLRGVDNVTPTSNGIVVETDACGICRSDWHAWKGHWPSVPTDGHILGHEPAGTVTGVGDEVEKFSVGDQVGIPFNIACGRCNNCWAGDSHLCTDGLSLGFTGDLPGAFASEFAIPKADFNAVHLPDGMSAVEMAGLGCRFATAFHGLAHKADVHAGDWLAVHGCGGIGLSAINIGAALGANVVAVDLNEDALSLAEQVGATATVRAGEQDVPKTIHDITDGGADISVDALGIAETCRNSINCLTEQGQHVQIGMTTDEEAGEIGLPVDKMVNTELEFVGVKGMPPSRYPELFRMIAGDKLSPADLVTSEVGLADVSDQLISMGDYETLGMEVVTEF